MTVNEIRLRRLGAQYLCQKTDTQTAVRGLCGFLAGFDALMLGYEKKRVCFCRRDICAESNFQQRNE